MIIDVALRPTDIDPASIRDQAVVVLDVLRATTTMAAALATGVKEIRIFGDVESARQAAKKCPVPCLLCGEVRCLPPTDFDLGNSPAAFGPSHVNQTVFMSTTNGTRAIIAAREAEVVLTGAIVNAAAVAERLALLRKDTLLLCAGTNGQVAMEDLLGAGAIIDALQQRRFQPASDAARIALRIFHATRHALRDALADAQGGRNVTAAGLPGDIDFAARLNSISAVGVVRSNPLRVVAF